MPSVNPTVKKRAQWRKHLRRAYGLTPKSYVHLLVVQNGVCAICRKPNIRAMGKRKQLGVDHCHTTKRVRGLLCHSCNIALGMLKDSPVLARACADYLEKQEGA